MKADVKVMMQDFAERIKNSVYQKAADLDAEVLVSKEPIRYADAVNGVFRPIAVGEVWGELFDCAWFRFTGEVPKQCAGKCVVLRIDLDGEGCIFNRNGEPVRGLTNII